METENVSAPASGNDRLRGHLIHHPDHQKPITDDGYHLPTYFDISTAKTGVYRGPELHQESAKLLQQMLTDNQTKYHVYFSEQGEFHNHRVHHLLAAYALGATPQHLQLAHDTMEETQRPRYPIDEGRVESMRDPEIFKSMLGNDRHFHEYVAFFWQRFEQDGWKQVVVEYLFSGTELAEDLYVRLFAGIWHNLILLGYGIEFELPGIVAEALAGACVHSNVFGSYIFKCEELTKKTPSNTQNTCLVQILQKIRDDPTLCDIDHWQGGNSFAYSDKIVSNAPPGMAELASQWKVETEQDLSYRTIEVLNVNAFITGAAQRREKAVKIDFIYVHQINASIFFSAFLQQSWLSGAIKSRLLETYARLCLLFYAASLGPELLVEEVMDYRPLKPNESSWYAVIQRCLVLPDDGHLPKLIRALAHGEKACQPFEQNDNAKNQLPLKGNMWLQVANMAIDSAEAEPDIILRWVRGAGSDEAWAEVPDRK